MKIVLFKKASVVKDDLREETLATNAIYSAQKYENCSFRKSSIKPSSKPCSGLIDFRDIPEVKSLEEKHDTIVFICLASADSCEVHELFKDMITSCYDFYSIKEEEKRTWADQNILNTSTLLCPEDWEHNDDGLLGSFDSEGRFAVYSGGGYLANLGYNKLTAKRIIDDLMKND